MKTFLKIVLCFGAVTMLLGWILFICDDNTEDKVITEIVNEEGVTFDVDLIRKGKLAENAESIDSDYIVINNKKYRFPIPVSDMISDNWWIAGKYSSEKIEANSLTSLLGDFKLYSLEGVYISMHKLCNETDEDKSMEDTILTEFSISRDEETGEFSADFILPGGIIPESTAADVVSVYGDPNDPLEFDFGKSDSDSLKYIYNYSSKNNYHFAFRQDGTLEYVNVTSNVDNVKS